MTGILLVLYILTLAINHDWPFGANTILVSDSYEQVGKLSNLIFDVFEGKSTLFYSNAIGGGMEIFSTFIYMFLCPFYLIALVGGRANFFYMYNIAACLILIFDACVFLWFTKKYFKRIGQLVRILLTLMFVFSAYSLMSISFLTWLMYPGILFLLIDAFLELVKTQKITKFCITLVWYVCTCFSVGISTAILLFVIFSLFIIFMRKGEKRKNLIFKFTVSYVISALACVVLLFPGLIATTGSNRMGSLVGNVMEQFDSTTFMVKLIPILLDALVFGLSIYYFISAKKTTKLYQFFITTLCILFVPVLFDCSLRLLCGSTYNAFASRFYFLNDALLFMLTLMLFNKPKSQLAEKSNRMFVTVFGVLFGIFVAVFVPIFVLFGNEISLLTKDPVASHKVLLILLVFFLGILLLLFICLFSKRRKLFSAKVYFTSIIMLFVFSLSFSFLSFGLFAHTKTDSDIIKLTQTENLQGKLKVNNSYEESHNLYNGDLKTNDAFSSLVSKQNASFENLGYICGSSFVSNAGATIISDSLCGIKYCIAGKDFVRPYYKLVRTIGDYAIYENLLATTGAVVFDKDFEFDFDLKDLSGLEKFKEKLGIDGQLAGGDGYSLEKVEMTDTAMKQKFRGYNLYRFSYTPTEQEIVYCNLMVSEKISAEDKSYFEAKNVFVADELHNGYDFDFVFAEAGQSNEAYILVKGDIDANEVKFLTLNYDCVERLCKKLQTMQANLSLTQKGYTVLASTTAESLLFVSSPNINGYEYILNDEKQNAQNVLGSFPLISLASGENTLVVTYHYPHKVAWIITLAVSLILIILLVLLLRYGKSKILKKVVFLSNIVLISIIIAFFEVLGVVLTFIVI